jgi:hypothetical protein
MMGFGLLSVVAAVFFLIPAKGRQAHVRVFVDRAYGA